VEEAEKQDSKVSMQGGLNETEVTSSVKSLQEESQQISELVEMERSYCLDVATQLKQAIAPLNVSYHIKPESVSKNDRSISDVVLTPQGMVCVFYSSGNVVSRPLESMTSEVLVRILMEVLPDAKVLMNEKRQKLTGIVMMLEKLAKEMRKIPNVSPRSRQVTPGGSDQPQPGASNARERPTQSQDAMRSAFVEK
jgi:hypothetical protein